MHFANRDILGENLSTVKSRLSDSVGPSNQKNEYYLAMILILDEPCSYRTVFVKLLRDRTLLFLHDRKT